MHKEMLGPGLQKVSAVESHSALLAKREDVQEKPPTSAQFVPCPDANLPKKLRLGRLQKWVGKTLQERRLKE